MLELNRYVGMLEQGAELGDSGAMFKLSQMYDEGFGVKQNKGLSSVFFQPCLPTDLPR
jgi:TPR repeat protein